MGRSRRQAPFALLQKGPHGSPRWIPLDGELVIGRDEGDVRIGDDRYVSGRHAAVEVRGEEVVLRDLGSRNGTFVKLTGDIELRHGDIFAVGSRLFRYLE